MVHRTIGITLGFTESEVVAEYGVNEYISLTSSVVHKECGAPVYFLGDIWNYTGWYICPHCGDPGLNS